MNKQSNVALAHSDIQFQAKEETMYALVLPSGKVAVPTLAPTPPIVEHLVRNLHKQKRMASFHELKIRGAKVLPVRILLRPLTEDEWRQAQADAMRSVLR